MVIIIASTVGGPDDAEYLSDAYTNYSINILYVNFKVFVVRNDTKQNAIVLQAEKESFIATQKGVQT